MIPEAGYIRIRGQGNPILVTHDLRIEVCQLDGAWIPFRGVCSATIVLRPNDIVRVTMEVEIGLLDLDGIPLRAVTALGLDQMRWTRWQRLVFWGRARWQQSASWVRNQWWRLQA